jgi:hypothetical protein
MQPQKSQKMSNNQMRLLVMPIYKKTQKSLVLTLKIPKATTTQIPLSHSKLKLLKKLINLQ